MCIGQQVSAKHRLHPRGAAEKTSGLRRPGAAALDLAYVACARTDGFFEMGLSAWDMAAGALLVQEAGGLVSDFGGEGDYLKTGNLVAGSPKIFGQLLPIIQSHCGEALKA
jgi:myo-inositol-1(or 4)-monophosphatase